MCKQTPKTRKGVYVHNLRVSFHTITDSDIHVDTQNIGQQFGLLLVYRDSVVAYYYTRPIIRLILLTWIER